MCWKTVKQVRLLLIGSWKEYSNKFNKLNSIILKINVILNVITTRERKTMVHMKCRRKY